MRPRRHIGLWIQSPSARLAGRQRCRSLKKVMKKDVTPPVVSTFLAGKRFIVAGVSRSGQQPANAIYKRFRDCGYEVVAVNPATDTVEGGPCYRDVASVPGQVDGILIAAPPSQGAALVQQAAERGIRQIWFHRSFGDGSVSADALQACADRGIRPIVGGCPLMFCGKVDVFHRCMRWWLGRSGRVPV